MMNRSYTKTRQPDHFVRTCTAAVPPRDTRGHAILTCFTIAFALVLFVLTSTGCGKREKDPAAAPGRAPSAGAERTVTVETAPVVERSWQLVVRAVGTLTADEQVRIRNEVGGIVRAIQAQEGDVVEAGQLILQLDDERASWEWERAEARYEEVRAALQRRRSLFEQELVAEDEWIQTQAAYRAATATRGLADRNFRDTAIQAPIAGTLGRRHISPGDYAPPGTLLFDLVKMDVLKVDFELPDRYLARIETGRPVRVRSNAFPEEQFEGTLDFIDPLMNPSTRTLPVRARIDNTTGRLRPHLFVQVELDLVLIENALVVPEQAVLSALGEYSLYVVNDEGVAEIRRLTLGEREPGYVQIVDGVQRDERVVTAGHQRLQPGVRVTERQEQRE